MHRSLADESTRPTRLAEHRERRRLLGQEIAAKITASRETVRDAVTEYDGLTCSPILAIELGAVLCCELSVGTAVTPRMVRGVCRQPTARIAPATMSSRQAFRATVTL